MVKIDTRGFFGVWKNVFGNWRYVLLAIFIAILFYSFNVLIAGWKTLLMVSSSYGFLKSVTLFFSLFVGFMDTILFSSYLSLIALSILIGVLFSMLIYKAYFNISYSDKKAGVLGGIGAVLAALIPGCAVCGIGLASSLGIGAVVLSFLPYDGLEISILAVILILIAIFKTTKNMYVCMVPNISFTKKLKGGKK